MNNYGSLIGRNKREKRELRKISNGFGFCFALVILIQVAFIWLFRIDEMNGRLGTIVHFFSLMLPYLLMLVPMRGKVADTLSIKRSKGHTASYFFIGLFFSRLASIASYLLMNLLNLFNVSSKTPPEMMEYQDTWWGTALFIINLAVIPALVEELICRGILLGTLRKYGNTFAIVTSATVFALMHANLEQIVFAFLMGLMLSFVVIKTGSLATAILIHFANNFLTGAFKVISKMVPEQIMTWVILITVGAVAVLGVIFYVKLRQIDPAAVSVKSVLETKSSLTGAQKAAYFVFTPGMALFLIYVVYETLYSINR